MQGQVSVPDNLTIRAQRNVGKGCLLLGTLPRALSHRSAKGSGTEAESNDK